MEEAKKEIMNKTLKHFFGEAEGKSDKKRFYRKEIF